MGYKINHLIFDHDTPYSIMITERKNKAVKGEKEVPEDARRAKNLLYGKRPGKWQMINRGEG